MKKYFAPALIAFTLVFAPTKKSEAAVGLFTGGAVLAVGALVTLGGGGAVLFADKKCRDEGCTLVLGALGLTAAALGLLILDGDQGLAFSEVDASMSHLQNVTAEEIETYNSELDQLNAINEQVTAEIVADKNTDAKALWSEMSEMVSPATLKIATLNGELFLNSLK